MPAIIWIAHTKPTRIEIDTLYRLAPGAVYRYIRVVSQNPDPRKIAEILSIAAKKYGDVYAVLVLPISTIYDVLDIIARLGLSKKIHILVPEVQVLGTVPETRAYNLPPGVGATCRAGTCVVYRTIGFREILGVQLYGKTIPIQPLPA